MSEEQGVVAAVASRAMKAAAPPPVEPKPETVKGTEMVAD